MFKMAILGSKELCSEFREHLARYSVNRNYSIELEIFSTIEKMQESIQNGCKYDLIFLNVDNKNSDLIQYIKALSNEKGRIVLISSLKTIPSEWINLQLFHIIPKELNYENVKECLNCYFKLIDFKKFFHYTKNGAKCIIAVSKIKYIKSNDKKITIYTSNDSIEFYGKLYEYKNDETLKNFIKHISLSL